jgi:hypothetical protein
MNSVLDNQNELVFDPEIEAYPKDAYGRRVCSADLPMKKEFAKGQGPWIHNEYGETDADSDYYIEYQCKNCGHIWRSEMPD